MPLFSRQQDDGGEDADGAEEVGGGEGDVEQGDGEQDGGEGFGGAEDACLGGLDVLEAQMPVKAQGLEMGRNKRPPTSMPQPTMSVGRYLQIRRFGWTV